MKMLSMTSGLKWWYSLPFFITLLRNDPVILLMSASYVWPSFDAHNRHTAKESYALAMPSARHNANTENHPATEAASGIRGRLPLWKSAPRIPWPECEGNPALLPEWPLK
jgi:hypothetical protein